MNIKRSTHTISQHPDAEIVDHIGNTAYPIHPLLSGGKIYGVNGVPGCGKTTLIDLLVMLLREQGITCFYLDTSTVIGNHIYLGTPHGLELAKLQQSLSNNGKLMPDHPTLGAVHHDSWWFANHLGRPVQFAFYVGCPRNLQQIGMFDQLGYNPQFHLIHVMGTFEESVLGARQRQEEGTRRADLGKERTRWNTWKHETLPGVQAFRRQRPEKFVELYRKDSLKSRLVNAIRFLGLPETTKNALCKKLLIPTHPVMKRITSIESRAPQSQHLEKCFV